MTYSQWGNFLENDFLTSPPPPINSNIDTNSYLIRKSFQGYRCKSNIYSSVNFTYCRTRRRGSKRSEDSPSTREALRTLPLGPRSNNIHTPGHKTNLNQTPGRSNMFTPGPSSAQFNTPRSTQSKYFNPTC